MRLLRGRPITAVLATGFALAVASCSDSSGGSGGISADDIEGILENSFANIPRMNEALQRLILTIQGNPQPGVTLTPITDGFAGTVGVDLDGNGSQETIVSGTLVFNDPQFGLASGAQLEITDIDGAAATGTLSAAVQPASATSVQLRGSGNFEADDVEVDVPDFLLVVDGSGSGPPVLGGVDFDVSNEHGEMFIEDDQQGGMVITVDFDGETITVP